MLNINFNKVQLYIIFGLLILSRTSTVLAPGYGIAIVTEGKVSAEAQRDAFTAAHGMINFFDGYGVFLEKPVRIVLAADTDTYILAQINEHGTSRKTAEDAVKMGSKGVIRGNTIIQNVGHASMEGSQDRIFNISHEMAHLFQRQLSANRIGPIWLDEGAASVLAVAAMGGDPSVKRFGKQSAEYLKSQASLPSLPHNNMSWAEAIARHGAGPTYAIADLAVILLGQKTNIATLVTYFRLRREQEYDVAFKRAFSITLEDFNAQFEQEISDHVRKL